MDKNHLNRQIILPSAKELQYCGRIDMSNANEPIFVYAASYVTCKFTGTSIGIIISNKHVCYDNYVGFIIDGVQGRILLPEEEDRRCIVLQDHLEDKLHEIIIFKRMDACHYFTFYGLILDAGARVIRAEELPDRRIEVYGDSVSAGEVSEAVEYIGKPDPIHNGEYSNAWYSYSWITARKLGARLHDIAQGGIPLLNGTGWFSAPNYYGIESTWDKLQYNLELGKQTSWDFRKYTPHVVIVAIGQNDNHPDDYMKEDYNSEKSQYWRERYKEWILQIRSKYPNALIILATTILGHDASWDRAIEQVCCELSDDKIVHFMYEKNGCGTPGHIRIPEAQRMAEELSTYIETFGDDIWK